MGELDRVQGQENRQFGRRGYDVIRNAFFVENLDGVSEFRIAPEIVWFLGFDEYYDHLQGDVYENACYMFWDDLSKCAREKNLDEERLRARTAFINITVDDYSLQPSEIELEQCLKTEKRKKLCRRWMEKFYACTTCEELAATAKKYAKSKLGAPEEFFLQNYCFFACHDEKRKQAYMEYVFQTQGVRAESIAKLCPIFEIDEIEQYLRSHYAKKWSRERWGHFFIQMLNENNIQVRRVGRYSRETGFYQEEIGWRYGKLPHSNQPSDVIGKVYKSFATFEEFAAYRNKDIRNCDFSEDYLFNYDLSEYIVDKTTQLPPHMLTEMKAVVKKGFGDGLFYVQQWWEGPDGTRARQRERTFDFFFDFVAFLKGDLKEAKLLTCDGLSNLKHAEGIDFRKAELRSALCERFGLEYEAYQLPMTRIGQLNGAHENEMKQLQLMNDIVNRDSAGEIKGLPTLAIDMEACDKIHYISDLHLLRRIAEAKCKSIQDVQYLIYKIVSKLEKEHAHLLLIAGDVSSDFEIYTMFVEQLAQRLRHTTVVFTLGNHELWSFPEQRLEDIVMKYRAVLEQHGMYLLHNDIMLFKSGQERPVCVPGETVLQMDEERRDGLWKDTRRVILGGIGFAKYNEKFNARDGVYRWTITREKEIEETNKFEAIYSMVKKNLERRNSIVLTHMPIDDWCADITLGERIVYVSGHTHHNWYHDDGEQRRYADNQIGYYGSNVSLKWFYLDSEYDSLEHLPDGIHPITAEQYVEFYRAKRENIRFNRTEYSVYALKKSGYYCFICKNRHGALLILNRGERKKLQNLSLEYYYERMDEMIEIIEEPLSKYVMLQKKISSAIKSIGGNGWIHGAIIDIDFYNHVFLNPVDLKITAYWANGMVNKLVYPSVSMLLEQKSPLLYQRYLQTEQEDVKRQFAVEKSDGVEQEPEWYYETEIYRASREIRKMQRLKQKILTTWHEDMLSQRKKIELS